MSYEIEIKKIKHHLSYEKDYYQKVKQLDALRFFYKENEKDKDRIIYNSEKDELEYSNSIKVAIQITQLVPKVLKFVDNPNQKQEIVTIMKNNFLHQGHQS